MTVGELIKVLADYCPDTDVATLDGNLLVSNIHGTAYGEDMPAELADEIDDGYGFQPSTLYIYID